MVVSCRGLLVEWGECVVIGLFGMMVVLCGVLWIGCELLVLLWWWCGLVRWGRGWEIDCVVYGESVGFGVVGIGMLIMTGGVCVWVALSGFWGVSLCGWSLYVEWSVGVVKLMLWFGVSELGGVSRVGMWVVCGGWGFGYEGDWFWVQWVCALWWVVGCW
ncbi:hypothetical protein Tco_1264698 [Tanacetum coccineum]